MIQYLSRLTSERDSLTQAANELTTKAAGEERDLTETERQSMGAWQQRCAEIDGQLVEYNAQAESQRAYARLRGELDAPAEEPVPMRRTSAELEVRSWGDAFTESDAFRAYSGRGSSETVMVPGPFEERAEITTGSLPAPWVTPPHVYAPAAYRASTPLLEVVGKVTTSASTVEWLRWLPNPAPAASLVAEGVAKPEMAMTAEAVSKALGTYAHWKGVTRQALEDIPQIRSIIEGRLRQGILTALEVQIGAALDADADIPNVTNADLLAGIRTGIATVEANGYGPANAVLLNPADYAAIDIAIMAGTLGGASVQGSYWGLRVVPVASLDEGTAYVGNMSTAIQLFTRGQTALYLTDSHADFFIRNVVLLLAEIRAIAAVTDPFAAVQVTTTAPVAAGASASAPSGGK